MAGPSFPDTLAHCIGFEWDAGNATKNLIRHRVEQREAEQFFFNRPVLVAPDHAHSSREARFAALGRTNEERLLTVVFTIRSMRIRVISARDMSRRERRLYERAEKENIAQERDPAV